MYKQVGRKLVRGNRKEGDDAARYLANEISRGVNYQLSRVCKRLAASISCELDGTMIDRAKRRSARYRLTSGLLFFLLFANFIRFAASRRSPILRRA